MSKFEIDEIALICRDAPYEPCDYATNRVVNVIGLECKILSHGQTSPTYGHFYFVRASNGKELQVAEIALRKRRPPEQPADDQEFIDWCNTLGRDTETTMRNVARNLQKFTEGSANAD